MLLDRIEKRPVEAQQYLERYVNDGSPSGFSELNRTSPQTDPLGLTPWFCLLLVSAPQEWFTRVGEIPQWIDAETLGTTNWLFVHPDMANESALRNSEIHVSVFDKMRVVPTSSGRTVQIHGRYPRDYIKLHYGRILGRIDRSMPLFKATAGLESSQIILEALESKTLNENLWVLPERGASVVTLPLADKRVEWGMAWRPHIPVGQTEHRVQHLWPFFSLFSVDRLTPYDPLLLCQLIECSGLSPKDFVLSSIVLPLAMSYVQLVSKLGLQPEWNAQNIMVNLDDDFRITGFTMKDTTDIERDLTIRKGLTLNCEFQSYPYKCISEEDGELYRIRHSFAFDFKLGEYVFEPLVYVLGREYGYELAQLRGSIRELIQPYLKLLPSGFFPSDGLWYRHDRMLLTGNRPYTAAGRPKYR